MASAYFVHYPRTVSDLRQPHLLSEEREYEILQTITLSAIDYENYITDMRVSRSFLEDVSGNCGAGQVMKCAFVKKRRSFFGILTVPDENARVLWAAYLDFGAV